MAFWEKMCCPVVCFVSSWCQDASDISSLCTDALHARLQGTSYIALHSGSFQRSEMHSVVHRSGMHSVHSVVHSGEKLKGLLPQG